MHLSPSILHSSVQFYCVCVGISILFLAISLAYTIWLAFCAFATIHIICYNYKWHTGVYEEMFYINSKIAQTKQNSWNFLVYLESTEMANFGDYPGDFILKSEDREIRSKNWSLPDYPGELTALPASPFTFFFFSNWADTIHL